jgi:SAM-dependent methyltransferase
MQAVVATFTAFALAGGALAAPLDRAAAAAEFPLPQRPVAGIVSPTWGDSARRDAAHEADQIAQRLRLHPGETVADIGAGSGYDTLRLARIVAPGGSVVAEDVTARYLQALRASADARHLGNVRIVLGTPGDPKLPPGSIDAAIMVHMYHEIERPYELLYNLAPAFRRGGLLGIEEADRPTEVHGTPPTLLTCELQAVGYRPVSLAQMQGGMGYFAVFAPPDPDHRPKPGQIRACPG